MKKIYKIGSILVLVCLGILAAKFFIRLLVLGVLGYIGYRLIKRVFVSEGAYPVCFGQMRSPQQDAEAGCADCAYNTRCYAKYEQDNSIR